MNGPLRSLKLEPINYYNQNNADLITELRERDRERERERERTNGGWEVEVTRAARWRCPCLEPDVSQHFLFGTGSGCM